MNLRVYIAGPITKGDLVHNINQATAAFVALAKAGLAPFCPHWSAYSKPCHRSDTIRFADGGGMSAIGDGPVVCEATVCGNDLMTHEDWLGIDLAWVGVSQAVLRLPGESTGADREVLHAHALGIPVFDSVEAVVAFAGTRRERPAA